MVEVEAEGAKMVVVVEAEVKAVEEVEGAEVEMTVEAEAKVVVEDKLSPTAVPQISTFTNCSLTSTTVTASTTASTDRK